MPRRALEDGSESFEVTWLDAAEPSRVVLFAVGGGGDPERHLPLLTSLAERGCSVVAPQFERLVSAVPSARELLVRARRLQLALDSVARPKLPVVGVGHSIGTTLLLALAGAQLTLRSGEPLAITPDPRLDRLALFTPATDFFRAPGALDAVRTPIVVWAGTKDGITPASQAEFLVHALGSRVPVELRIVKGAGHFSFMNVLPPQTTEPLPNREVFLEELSAAVCDFATNDAKPLAHG